jgi:Pentapeptide repeats (9 copies)
MAGSRVPFPGPKPYDYDDWESFKGRSDDVEEVVNRLLSERLTILTGPSGAGKTSLLRAGIEPMLQEFCERSSEGYSKYRLGLALVLREWGRGGSADQLLANALRAAIANRHVGRLTPEEALSAISRTKGFVPMVSKLASAAGGLVLIVDQFEEILRPGNEGEVDLTASEAVDLIGKVYRSVPDVSVLLCLREEHHSDLRRLERVVEGLYGRTYWLKRLTVGEAADAFGEAMAIGEIKMEEPEVLEVIAWTQIRRDQEAASDGKDRDVDLLSANTLFRELYSYSLERGCKLADEDLVADFRRQHGSEAVGQEVLHDWIADGFKAKSSEDEESQVALATRIAVRMAPYLSSSGFKTKVEEVDLLAKALSNDLEALGVEQDDFRSQLRLTQRSRAGSKATKSVSWTSTSTADARSITSGRAREEHGEEHGWTVQRTIDALVDAGQDALRRYDERSVLKRIWSQGTVRRWELVHDGLGEPVRIWAEERIGTLPDAAAALTARRGDQILVLPDQVPGSLLSLNWKGCWVGGPKKTRPVFDRTRFQDCSLPGTLFEACDFRDVLFHQCILDGVIFRDCNLQGVVFSECEAGGLTLLGGSANDVTFRRCEYLTHLGISKVQLSGPIVFDRSKVTSAAFTEIERKGVAANRAIVNKDSRLTFSWWDQRTSEMFASFQGIDNNDVNVNYRAKRQ